MANKLVKSRDTKSCLITCPCPSTVALTVELCIIAAHHGASFGIMIMQRYDNSVRILRLLTAMSQSQESSSLEVSVQLAFNRNIAHLYTSFPGIYMFPMQYSSVVSAQNKSHQRFSSSVPSMCVVVVVGKMLHVPKRFLSQRRRLGEPRDCSKENTAKEINVHQARPSPVAFLNPSISRILYDNLWFGPGFGRQSPK